MAECMPGIEAPAAASCCSRSRAGGDSSTEESTAGQASGRCERENPQKTLEPWKNRLENTQSGRRKCHGAQPLDFSPPASSNEWGTSEPTDDGKPNRHETNARVKPCRNFGGINLRAHAEIISVRRCDTPTLSGRPRGGLFLPRLLL